MQKLLRQANQAFKSKQYEQAQEKAHSVLKTEPLNSAAWHLLGLVALEQKHYDEAAGFLTKAVETTPKARYHFNLAIALRRLGRLDESIIQYQACLAKEPKMLQAWTNLGNVYRAKDSFEQAIDAFKQALEVEPTHSMSHYQLATVYQEQANWNKAIQSYQRAIKYDPNNHKALCQLGIIHARIQRFDQALSYFDRAIKVEPYFFETHVALADTLLEVGQSQLAQSHYRQALKLKPDACSVLRQITLCHHYGDSDHKDAQYIQALFEHPSLADEQKMHLHFALGKIFLDSGKTTQSFEHFRKANHIQFKTNPFNIYSLQAYVKSIKERFNADFMSQWANAFSSQTAPIILLGPSQSGKSWCESLLSSVPDLDGGGEAGLQEFGATNPTQQGSKAYPDWVSDFDVPSGTLLQEHYVNRLKRQSNAPMIMDTMSANVFYLGLIKILFPNAKFIYIKRDPIELGLSMYFTYYPDKHLYTYDLETIGQFIRLYDNMVDHWRSIDGIEIIDVDVDKLREQPKPALDELSSSMLLDVSNYVKLEPQPKSQLTQRFLPYVDALQKGLSFDPDSHRYELVEVLKKASIQHQSKSYEMAAKLYRYAAQLAPQSPIPPHLLGVLLYETGQFEQAIASMKHAVTLDPNYAQAHQNLAAMLKAHNKPDESQHHADIAKRLNEAYHQRHHQTLQDTHKAVLANALSAPMTLLKEFERKQLFKGKLKESHDKPGTSVAATFFRDLSYGSYRLGGQATSPRDRSQSWHQLNQHLSVIKRLFQLDENLIKVLDVGCGTGLFRRLIEGNVSFSDEKEIYYWGVDNHPALLEKAATEISDVDSGAAGNFCPSAFVLQDVEFGLPFQDNTFNLVVSFESMETLSMTAGVNLIAEMHRVLKPGGHLCLSTALVHDGSDMIQNLSFVDWKHLFEKQGFEIESEFGGALTFEQLVPLMSEQEKHMAEQLRQYHPDELIASMLAPFYLDNNPQRLFVLKKA